MILEWSTKLVLNTLQRNIIGNDVTPCISIQFWQNIYSTLCPDSSYTVYRILNTSGKKVYSVEQIFQKEHTLP